MIQKWIKDECKKVVRDLEWTVDFKTAKDNTGVVYQDDPVDRESRGDLEMFVQEYTIQMSSSRRNEIEERAWMIYNTLDKRRKETIRQSGQNFYLIFARQKIQPYMIGIEDRKAIYNLRLECTLKRI